MKTIFCTVFSVLLCFSLVFSFGVVWNNCTLATYGASPALSVALQENGDAVLFAGDEVFVLRKKPSAEEQFFSRYPALLPGVLRLALSLSGEQAACFFARQQQCFKEALFWQGFAKDESA